MFVWCPNSLRTMKVTLLQGLRWKPDGPASVGLCRLTSKSLFDCDRASVAGAQVQVSPRCNLLFCFCDSIDLFTAACQESVPQLLSTVASCNTSGDVAKLRLFLRAPKGTEAAMFIPGASVWQVEIQSSLLASWRGHAGAYTT